MEFKEFNYLSLNDLIDDVNANGLELPISENIDVLARKVKIDKHTLPNSLAIHPMEGCDGNPDGSPGELTIRRYERLSKGGAGLLWFEAVAVVPEGRANPRQLWITPENIQEFKNLNETIKKNSQDENGFIPLLIMQLTHSGRYSKPYGKPVPIIAYHNKYLDAAQNLDESYQVIEDGELEKLEDTYVEAALLAKQAGFDGVDIKCCHGYLICELLSAFTRTGKYGENFEGRTRFLFNIVDKIKSALGNDFIITSRMNIYDALPYPFGWGADKEDGTKIDLSEPIKLVKLLHQKGVKIINATMGNPYYNPHINRPFDKGPYTPPEHPLVGVCRMMDGIGKLQKAVPDMVIVATGFSWLRHFSPYIAAGMLEQGLASIIGYGREAFAYPDFARDIVNEGLIKKDKCCISCGKCSQIMRAGGTPGCVIRDSKEYASIYNKYVLQK